MSEARQTISNDYDDQSVEALMQETLDATAAVARLKDRAHELGLRVVIQESDKSSPENRHDEAASTSANVAVEDNSGLRVRVSRAPWRERLIEAERGMAHALRSESTLLGYTVVIATAMLAAGILKVQGLQLVAIGFLAVQSVLIELIRIAIREAAGPSSKASQVASAASILAASVAAGATAFTLISKILSAI